MKWLSSTVISLSTLFSVELPASSSQQNAGVKNYLKNDQEHFEQNTESAQDVSFAYWGISTQRVFFPAIKVGVLFNLNKRYNLDLSSDFIYYSSNEAGVFSSQILEKKVNKTWYIGLGSNVASTLFNMPREVVAQPVFSIKKNIGAEAFIRFTSGFFIKPCYIVKSAASEFRESDVTVVPLGFSICTSF